MKGNKGNKGNKELRNGNTNEKVELPFPYFLSFLQVDIQKSLLTIKVRVSLEAEGSKTTLAGPSARY